mmetsp:Transcript_12947/g.54786  ORF Transcript_12947/g.54786 Transcript_12947/m.54786 type:complete len:277 (-) Transcript_12947:3250-4080(-)
MHAPRARATMPTHDASFSRKEHCSGRVPWTSHPGDGGGDDDGDARASRPGARCPARRAPNRRSPRDVDEDWPPRCAPGANASITVPVIVWFIVEEDARRANAGAAPSARPRLVHRRVIRYSRCARAGGTSQGASIRAPAGDVPLRARRKVPHAVRRVHADRGAPRGHPGRLPGRARERAELPERDARDGRERAGRSGGPAAAPGEDPSLGRRERIAKRQDPLRVRRRVASASPDAIPRHTSRHHGGVRATVRRGGRGPALHQVRVLHRAAQVHPSG